VIYPPAYFYYQVTPAVVPCSESPAKPGMVTLMFTVSNRVGRGVPVEEIAFQLPIGPDGGQLTEDPAVSVSAAAGTDWDIISEGNGVLRARPRAADGILRTGGSIAFFVSSVAVNQRPGTAFVTIWELTDELRQTDLAIAKMPPGLAITSFRASPIQVAAGQKCELSWSTTGASRVTLTSSGTTRDVTGIPGLPVHPRLSTIYTLTASGQDKVTHEQLTVYVPEVRVLSFDARPPVIKRGECSTLSWVVDNADTVRISASGDEPDPGEVDPQEGHVEVCPRQLSTTYTLRARGFGRSIPVPETVDIEPTVESFTVSPDRIITGEKRTVTLEWKAHDTSRVAICPGVGEAAPEGKKCVESSGATTQYRLTAKNLPTPAIAKLLAVPAIKKLEIAYVLPDPVNLRWEAACEKLTIKNGTGAPEPVPPDDGRSIKPPFGAIDLTAETGSVACTASFRRIVADRQFAVMLSCPDGLNTPGAEALLGWRYAPGVTGWIWDGAQRIRLNMVITPFTYILPPADRPGWGFIIHYPSPHPHPPPAFADVEVMFEFPRVSE
jgi:hypothetical protein